MKVMHSSITCASRETDSMHMSALSVSLNALFYVYRIKWLLLMQCLITDLGTMLSGCELHSGHVICFGILLWFSLLLKDGFLFILFSKVRCKMQR